LFLWASQLPDQAAPPVFFNLASRYAAHGNVGSLQRLAAYASDTARGMVLEELGKVVGKQEDGKTLESIRSLPATPAEQAHALVGALRSAPAAQLQPILQAVLSTGDDATKIAAVRAYVNHVFTTDRRQAVGWVESASPEMRPTAIRSLVARWFPVDTKAAWLWIKAQPHGSDRDLAVSVYVEALWKTDPTLAEALASEIDDEGTRNQLLSSFRER